MTTWWGWAARRARASSLLLATLVALVTVTTAILAFVVGQAGTLATDAARAALSIAAPGAGAVQAQTRLGPDPTAQDGVARSALTEGFSPAPVTVHTTYVSEPRRPTVNGGEAAQRVTLWSGEHLSLGLLSVNGGTWPSAADEAALQSGAAAELGLSTGDTLTVDGHTLKITALWEASEPSSPLWFGDPLVTDGADAASVGPLIVDRSVLTGGNPFIRWSVVPDAERITPQALDVLAAGADRAKALVAGADVTGRGIVVDGDLASTAERASRDWEVGRAFGIVPVSVLLLVAAVGLVQVSGLLAATRQREHELLAARGAARRQLIVTGLAESTLVAVLGAALGSAVALGALWLTSRSTAQFDIVLLGGAGSLLLTVVALWTVTIRATSSLTGRPQADRVRAVAGAAALVVVFAAAALTTWQLRGADSLQFLPALAPAFLLAAAAVLGLAALGPITRLVEAAGRLAGTTAWLAAAQLARGLLVHAVPVTLTILATGTATFASLYAGTAATTHRDLTMLVTGAPLRATLSSLDAGTQGLQLPDLAAVDGVSASVPVWLDDSGTVGDTPVAVLAGPLDRLSEVATLPAGLAFPELPGRVEDVDPLTVPDGATTLHAQLDGRVYLDEWQQEYFDRADEFNRASAADLPPQEAEFLAQVWTEDYLDRVSRTSSYSLRLTLRDVATGVSRTVNGPSVSIDQPDPDGATPPGDRPFWRDLVGTAAADIALPQDGAVVVESVQLVGPPDDNADRSMRLEIALSADGVALGGVGDWTSDLAVTEELAGPYREALASVEPAWEPRTHTVTFEDGTTQTFHNPVSNKPPVPQATVDARGEVWRVETSPALPLITFGANVPFEGHDPQGVMAGAAPAQPAPVPVAITTELGDATTLGPGDALDLAAFGRRIPAVVAAVTPALPGLTTELGVLADSGAVSAHLATTANPLRWPSELWATLDGDPSAVRAAAAQVPGVSALRTPDETPIRTATAARSLWIAAGSALLLSLTGLAAAAATQLAARRPEVAVLRALGMTPRAQRRSRTLESGGLLVIATLAGIASGVAVAWLVVDPLVQAAQPAGPGYRSPLTAEVLPWAALLGAGAVALLLILWLVGRTVQRQALDPEYREEVR
ncbi:ABC transporter permease [Tessaracoccus sp. MC1756]|uniref:ABC transporter permease n=1 Tax=Tessaracoccus sp. MC1756 TaxID=2760311 RepID=UPI0016021B0B|nr:ABC transporter permease [Tessaracoccus sp. MC1756]MBB1508623.1 FtsX-like permease family protein [Tessaracoccus sp. MC1756]